MILHPPVLALPDSPIATSPLHYSHQALEYFGYFIWLPDHGARKMGQSLKEAKGVSFWIDKHHPELRAIRSRRGI